MKIGLTGAQGSGKTTLAEHFAKNNGYNFIKTDIGSVLKRNKMNLQETEMSLLDRLVLQLEIAEHVAEVIESAPGYTIFDRTVVDVYAVTLCLIPADGKPLCEDSVNIVNYIRTLALANISYLSHTVLCSPIPLEDIKNETVRGGLRGSLDDARRQAMHCTSLGALYELHNDLHKRFAFLNTPVFGERVQALQEVMGAAIETEDAPKQMH